jgi:hypothetical protein
MGAIKGMLREETGGVSLAWDLGWKHAVLLCLLVLLMMPLASVMMNLRSPQLVTGVVVMGLSFAFMWAGGAVIEGQWDQLMKNAISGFGNGVIVGIGFWGIGRLGWAKSPFAPKEDASPSPDENLETDR